MSKLDKYNPEKQFQMAIKHRNEQFELNGKIKLHNLSSVKFTKARKKYVKKKLRYFSINDNQGTVLFYDPIERKMTFNISERSTPSSIERLRCIYHMEIHNAMWAVIHMYLKEGARLMFNFIFDFHQNQTIPILIKTNEVDLEDITPNQTNDGGLDDQY